MCVLVRLRLGCSHHAAGIRVAVGSCFARRSRRRRYYVYAASAHTRRGGSSDNVMFIDTQRATLKVVVLGQGPIQHDQLDIAGNEMTFSQAVPDGHPCDTTDVGVYRFTVSANVLRFQAIKDTCSARKIMLTGHDLTLSSS